MGLAELVLLAIGLSMDAFAVSICKGLGMKKINLKVAVVLGLFFGGFQAGMPVIGWALGSQFLGIIGPIDHWIAFILLAFIGGKMLWEAFTEDEDEGDGKDAEKIDLGEYLTLAIVYLKYLSFHCVANRHYSCKINVRCVCVFASCNDTV